jgi:hypothetical protein
MATRQTLTYGIIAAAVAVAIVAGVLVTNSMQTSSQSSSGSSAQLNIYLTDAPPASLNLKYLLVNASSVELRYAGNVSTTSSTNASSASSASNSTSSTTSTSSVATTSASTSPSNVFLFTVPANVGTNVNLTSLHGQSLLLGAVKMPPGNITSIVLNITGAKAFYTDGSSEQLKVVADGKLMVPIHFAVQTSGATDLTIDLTPNLVHISQGGVLTPVIHVTVVERGQNNATTTKTADVTESSQ